MTFWKRLNWVVNPNVYVGSSVIIWSLVLLTILFNEASTKLFTDINDMIVNNFSWLYVGAVGFFLIFCFYLLLSRFGDIKLGKPNEKPQFRFLSWISMLFSAGMGIGLLFYAVAEPVMHFTNYPEGKSLVASSLTTKAMNVTFFHWGLHAWAIYVVVGLSLAFGHFRKGRPLSIRYTLYPLFGKRVEGVFGDVIDIVAVVGTLFGVATSLGLGVVQINSGLSYVFGIPTGVGVQSLLIALITLAATISVVTGVEKGIRILSEANIVVAIVLLLFVFAAGNSTQLLNFFFENVGSYLRNLPHMTFQTGTRTHPEWMGSWTLFYWGWWMAWSPFVGMFIARISRGRTLKEFVAGVLFIPTIFTFFWMTVFGESAISMIKGGNEKLENLVNSDISISLFAFLENLPFSSVTPLLAVIVVMTFFVTSSDSGSFVIDMITSGGHPNPPAHQKVYWAVLEGVVAAVLLVAGGLTALQTAAINVALPFSVVIIFICFSLLKELKQEYREIKEKS